MKRWNGWGHTNVEFPLHAEAWRYIEAQAGAGQRWQDARLDDVLARMPASRLKSHALVITDAKDRVLHSAGQSFADWVAMRSGSYPAFVDGVAFPTSPDEVRQLIRYAQDTGTRLIPYGGGTSVVGHINPLPGDAPVLTVNLSRMSQLVDFDPVSQLATFQAGIAGPDIEAQLRARGYTLGHFPQSFEFSTLGGWVATRSSGQQSRFFGRIEQLFAGGSVETPLGTLQLPNFPASAAGPDLREMVLGSEGRIGIITRAAVRVTQAPEYEAFEGIVFPTFEQGMAAAQHIAQAVLPISMLRLSNARETETNLSLAHGRSVALLQRYLTWRGAAAEKCLLIFGVTGTRRVCAATRKTVIDMAKQQHGIVIGKLLGNAWRKNRFRGAYLRNTLWDKGYAVDTLETATTWACVPQMMTQIEASLRDTAAANGAKAHVFTHLSHVYPTGSSVYTTYVYPLGATPEATLANWQRMKAAASEAIVRVGGTISHQHGVGLDHAPYLQHEKGAAGIQAIQAMLTHFDPNGLMNPGKLVRDEAKQHDF